MLRGFPEYGCSINPLKTQLNFDMDPTEPDSEAALEPDSEAALEREAAAGTAGAEQEARMGGSMAAGSHPLVTPSDKGMGGHDSEAVAACPLFSRPPLLLRCNTWVAGDGQRFLRWCGLLLNADSLEVQVSLK